MRTAPLLVTLALAVPFGAAASLAGIPEAPDNCGGVGPLLSHCSVGPQFAGFPGIYADCPSSLQSYGCFQGRVVARVIPQDGTPGYSLTCDFLLGGGIFGACSFEGSAEINVPFDLDCTSYFDQTTTEGGFGAWRCYLQL
jgi:hypothetical protein